MSEEIKIDAELLGGGVVFYKAGPYELAILHRKDYEALVKLNAKLVEALEEVYKTMKFVDSQDNLQCEFKTLYDDVEIIIKEAKAAKS